MTTKNEPDGEIETGGLAGRLQLAMELRRKNPNQIANATGVTRQTLYAVLGGRTKNFSYPVLSAVAKELNIRAEWLARGELPMLPVKTLKDDEEIQLIENFRRMSPLHARDLADIAQRWAEEDQAGELGYARPFHHPKPPKAQ